MTKPRDEVTARDEVTPSFFLVGAQKCATTWLFHCLNAHPGLFLPPGKRENHYLGGDVYLQRGHEWYLKRFEGAGADQRLGDASVDYMFDPRGITAVRELSPRARILMVLRDPVDRAISAYFWEARQGLFPGMELGTALRRSLCETRACLADPDRRISPTAALIMRGLYRTQVDRIEAALPTENVHIELFDEIVRAPAGVLARCYRFLDVEEEFRPSVASRRPKAAGPMRRPSMIEDLSSRAGALGPGIRRMGRIAREVLSTLGFSPPPVVLTEDLRADLDEVFSDSQALMEEVRERLSDV